MSFFQLTSLSSSFNILHSNHNFVSLFSLYRHFHFLYYFNIFSPLPLTYSHFHFRSSLLLFLSCLFFFLSFLFYIFWLLFNINSHIYYCYSIILFLLLFLLLSLTSTIFSFILMGTTFDVIVWKDSINFPAPFCFFGFHNSQCIDPFLIEDFSFPQVFFHHIIIFNQHAKNMFIDIFEFSRPISYSETPITNLWHIFISLFENEFIFIWDCSFHSHWDRRNCLHGVTITSQSFKNGFSYGEDNTTI